MSPRPIPPGEVGKPITKPTKTGFICRVRYTRLDGVKDRANKNGKTPEEAERRALAEARLRVKEKLVRVKVDEATGERSAVRRSERISPSTMWREAGKNLRMDASIAEVADVYLLSLNTKYRHLSQQVRNQNRRTVRKHVVETELGSMPAYKLSVGDISAWYDAGIDRGQNSTAHQALSELRKIIDIACEIGIREDNPARVYHAQRVPSPPGYIATIDDLQLIRRAIRHYVERPGRKGPKPQPYLRHTIDIISGTSLRIGEVMSLEWDREVVLNTDPPIFKLVGNTREGHGVKKEKVFEVKNRDGGRRIPLPDYVVDVLRERWAQAQVTGRLTYVFETNTGRPVGMHQIRVQLWKVRDWIEETNQSELQFSKGITSHAFRRLALDTLAEEKGLTTAARQGGQREASVTERFYAHNRRSVPDSRDTFDQFAPSDEL